MRRLPLPPPLPADCSLHPGSLSLPQSAPPLPTPPDAGRSAAWCEGVAGPPPPPPLPLLSLSLLVATCAEGKAAALTQAAPAGRRLTCLTPASASSLHCRLQ